MTAHNVVEILLVEDNPQDLELALRALKKANLANHIQVAATARRRSISSSAKEPMPDAASTTPPGMVLLDLKLPKVDGLEVLQRLKNFEGFAAAVHDLGLYWLLLNHPPGASD